MILADGMVELAKRLGGEKCNFIQPLKCGGIFGGIVKFLLL